LVARGSIAYSAVTHPSPLSRRQRGTLVEAEASEFRGDIELAQQGACYSF